MVLSRWRLILIIFGIMLSICFWILLEGTEDRRYNDFVQKEYSGTIKDIVFKTGRAGCPDILLENNWVFLTIEEQKVFDEIRINDSIVKRKNSDRIFIYRKDSTGGKQLKLIY